MLSTLKTIFFPQKTLTRSEFANSSAAQLGKQILASQVTYFGIAAAAMTVIYKFFPKIYIKMHRYAELRPLLQYATPKPFLRMMAELGVEYCMCVGAHQRMPWVKETFPSPMHALVAWRGLWPAIGNFFNPFHNDQMIDRDFMMKDIIGKAPASVIAAAVAPAGNDIMTVAKSLYMQVVKQKKADMPRKRALLVDTSNLVTRTLMGVATGYAVAAVGESAWKRIGMTTVFFCLDVFGVRAFLIPKIADYLAPYEVNGEKFIMAPNPDEQRPFVDENEKEQAQLLLMRLTAEQMQWVQRYCWEIIIADHCRGAVKAEACRLMRYANLLQEGTTNEGVELEDLNRVASVYDSEDNELETHGVDAEHRTCSVCLVDFNKTDKVATVRKCKHTFHLDCVQQWWSQHNSCPMCRDELMREQSSTGSEDFMAEGEGGAAAGGAGAGGEGGEGGGAGGARNNRRRRGGEGGEDQAPAADAGQGQSQLMQRFFRGSMKMKCPNPSHEWGPLKVLYYNIGRDQGLNLVRELTLFDPELQLQVSNYDLWHVIFVNLIFSNPCWDYQ